MKNIQIQVPEGYEIDQKASTFENIVFKEIPKSITERVKTFSDVCTILGKNEKDFEPNCNEDESDAAMRKVKAIVKVLNEGWYPDFENHNQCKYAPWFKKERGEQVLSSVDYCDSATNVPAPTLFKSRELATYAGTQFIHIYTKAFKL